MHMEPYQALTVISEQYKKWRAQLVKYHKTAKSQAWTGSKKYIIMVMFGFWTILYFEMNSNQQDQLALQSRAWFCHTNVRRLPKQKSWH